MLYQRAPGEVIAFDSDFLLCLIFFFNDTATTEIYTLSLHDALPIYHALHEPDEVEDREERGDEDNNR